MGLIILLVLVPQYTLLKGMDLLIDIYIKMLVSLAELVEQIVLLALPNSVSDLFTIVH